MYDIKEKEIKEDLDVDTLGKKSVHLDDHSPLIRKNLHHFH